MISSNPNEGVENFWITELDLRKEKTFPGFWQKPMFLKLRTQKGIGDSKVIHFRELVRVIDDY